MLVGNTTFHRQKYKHQTDLFIRYNKYNAWKLTSLSDFQTAMSVEICEIKIKRLINYFIKQFTKYLNYILSVFSNFQNLNNKHFNNKMLKWVKYLIINSC